MSAVNDTKLKSAMFLLTRIPGQEDVHLWISIPFCFIYVFSILGNSTILFIIKTDPSLHEPMYIFLSMLAVTDLGLSISTIPTILGIYLFNSSEISLNACFAQLFFIHSFVFTESSILLLMAFDRFVAISNPLRYASILTLPRISKMGLVCVLRGVAVSFPFPFLLKRFQYCRANVLSHSYCLHQDVMNLACSDITVNYVYGLFLTVFTVGLDSLLIFLSYMMILKTVLSIASHAECLRALNTCVSHLCAVLLFYIPDIGLGLIHRLGKGSSPLLQIVLGYIFLLAPTLMNPIMYSVKSKHLRSRIIRVFRGRRDMPAASGSGVEGGRQNGQGAALALACRAAAGMSLCAPGGEGAAGFRGKGSTQICLLPLTRGAQRCARSRPLLGMAWGHQLQHPSRLPA
ncbi:olfactory receptor 51G2-like [Emys orbicularis]|uniref:olfactory receptor 51G2-like n=1 Tax=Emys orbicularis TaxID=82168 RepID=UPI0031FCD58A